MSVVMTEAPVCDAGTRLHSPSAMLMKLTDIDHMNDFNDVVHFLKIYLDDIVNEVHGFHKLLIDDGKVQLNCPPVPEDRDTHGGLLIRTISEGEEKAGGGLRLKREFKVHDLGEVEHQDDHSLHRIEVRCDVVAAPEEEGGPMIEKEEKVVFQLRRHKTRGDSIISKDYRGDNTLAEKDTFFRQVKFSEDGDPPPALNISGVNYVYIKKNGLIFGVTTKWNCSPTMYVALLSSLARVFKDYCGVLSEEAIRKNFILIYELLDEMLDFGYPQNTSSEALKACVYNEPLLVESARHKRLSSHLKTKTTPSSSVHKPISLPGRNRVGGAMAANSKQKNEIFVDILERLNVLFSPTGQVVNSTIDGCIQMKSYLSGNPALRLALNEDLVVGKGGGDFGSVVLDDCNFHECVRLDDFETQRQLSFVPPDGEFVVLNYRMTGEFRAPFRVFPSIEEISATMIEVTLTVRADIPEANHGAGVRIKVNVPRTTNGVGLTVDGGAKAAAGGGGVPEYNATDRAVLWTIKKLPGGSELTLRMKISLSAPSTSSTRREIGPVSLHFEIPMYNVSNLQVRYLKIEEKAKSYNPYRWVRYVTQSSSYVVRIA